MDPKNYTITTEEAAKLIGVSPRMLQSLRAAGKGPGYYRPGHRTVLYDPTEIMEWARGRVRDASKVA